MAVRVIFLSFAFFLFFLFFFFVERRGKWGAILLEINGFLGKKKSLVWLPFLNVPFWEDEMDMEMDQGISEEIFTCGIMMGRIVWVAFIVFGGEWMENDGMDTFCNCSWHLKFFWWGSLALNSFFRARCSSVWLVHGVSFGERDEEIQYIPYRFYISSAILYVTVPLW